MKRVTAFATCLYLSLTLLYSQNITGKWRGETTIEDMNVEFFFEFMSDSDGLKGNLRVPSLNNVVFQADTILFDGTSLKFIIKALGFTYEAKYENSSFTGKFYQTGLLVDLRLIRDYEEQREQIRPQEPKAPYPYITEDVSFKSLNGDVALAGTITIPRSSQPVPLIVLIPGFNALNRDSELFQHKTFLVLSDYLTRQGYAVFRYDPRGRAFSGGIYDDADLFTMRDDALAAINTLRNRKEIDKSRVGVIGHNEGGIAAFLLGEKDNISFIVTLAAPALRGDITLLTGMQAQSAAAFTPVEAINRSHKAYSEIFNKVLESDSLSIRVARESNLIYHKYYPYATEDVMERVVNQYMTKRMYNYIRFDPTESISAIKIPLLALYGDKDIKVISSHHLPAITNILNENSKAKVVELEGINNLFQRCTSGDQLEYLSIEQTIDTQVLEMISEWIGERVN